MRWGLLQGQLVDSEDPASTAAPHLTEKQREVLDLLLDHKTSKEIALALGISPHTVDQRIQFAKQRLGARSRSDLARLYRESRKTYGQLTYGDSHMLEPPLALHQPLQDERSLTIDQDRTDQQVDRSIRAASRLVPDLFEGRSGKWFRLAFILAITFFALLITLGGLATYATLANLLRN